MLRIETPPAEPVVSLDEIKIHVRVDHDDDDIYLEALVTAATGLVDGPHGWLGRALVTQTWICTFEQFPRDGRLYIPLGPIQSVSVEYTNAAGDYGALTAYEVFGLNSDGRAYVAPPYGQSWPSAQNTNEAIYATFVAGYGAASAVPAGIKHAIKLIVSHWYENREDVSNGKLVQMPMASEALLMPYRLWPS